jgi:hypothetical protein
VKLTTKQRHKLLREYHQGIPVVVIGRRYGVTPSYVSVLAKRTGTPMRRAASPLNLEARIKRLVRHYGDRVLEEIRR